MRPTGRPRPPAADPLEASAACALPGIQAVISVSGPEAGGSKGLDDVERLNSLPDDGLRRLGGD